MDQVVTKTNTSVGATASISSCPLLAKNAIANIEHCRRVGSLLQKNEAVCKKFNCTSLWRVCWACAGQIPAPDLEDSGAVNPFVGLCSFHMKHGAKTVKKKPLPPLPAPKVAGKAAMIVEPAKQAPHALPVPPATKPTEKNDVAERVLDGEVLEKDDPRLKEIERLNKKYRQTAPIEIRLELIDPDPKQPREYFDPAEMVGLTESIRAVGQQEPGLVVEAEGGRFRLIDGERRLRACRDAPQETYLAWVCNQHEAGVLFAMSVMKNFNRSRHTPLEIARSLQRLKFEFGYNNRSIAKIIGESEMYVGHYLKLNELTPEVAALVDKNLPENQRLNASAGVIIAKLPPEQQVTAAKRVLRERLSVVQTTQLVRRIAGEQGLELRGRTLTPLDKRRVILGRLQRVAEVLELYVDVPPAEYADAFRGRALEIAHLNQALARIERALVKLRLK